MKSSTVAKGCGFGCAGLVLLVILGMVAAHFLITPEMREEFKKKADAEYQAGLASDKAKVDPFFQALSDLRAQLPPPEAMSERPAAGFKGDEVRYMAVDYACLQQFTDHGFVEDAPAQKTPPFYRDQAFRNLEGNAVPTPGMTHPDYRTIGLVIDGLAVVPYVAVFEPVTDRPPVLAADGKSFQPGHFDGWVVLVDWKTKKPLGQARVTADSSPEIRSFQIGLHSQMLFGDDLKSAMEKDYQNHFWQAANAAVAKVCGKEGQAHFAEHQAYFSKGGN